MRNPKFSWLLPAALLLPACGEPLDDLDVEFRRAGWWTPENIAEPDVKLFDVAEESDDDDDDGPTEIDPECLIWDVLDHIHVTDPAGNVVIIMDGNFLYSPTEDPDNPQLECVVANNTIGVPQQTINEQGLAELGLDPVLTLRANNLLIGDRSGTPDPEVAFSFESMWVFEGHVDQQDRLWIADKILTPMNGFRKLLIGALALGACGAGPTPQ